MAHHRDPHMDNANGKFHYTTNQDEIINVEDIGKFVSANPNKAATPYTCCHYSARLNAAGYWENTRYNNVKLHSGVVWNPDHNYLTLVDHDVKIHIYFFDNDHQYISSIYCENLDKFRCHFTYDAGFPSASFYENGVMIINYLHGSIEICGGVRGNLNILMSELEERQDFWKIEKLPVISNLSEIEAFNAALIRPRHRSFFAKILKMMDRRSHAIAPVVAIKEGADQATVCKICNANVADYVMIPCGHRICCNVCHNTMTNENNRYLTECIYKCGSENEPNSRLMKMY